MPQGTLDQRPTDLPRLEQAREAIRQLDLAPYIEQNHAAIFRHIEQAYARNRGETNDGLMFIADSLPVTSAIIQIASTIGNSDKAKEWVHERLPTANEPAVLTMLTLIYIIHTGCEAALNSGDQRLLDLWSEIAQKVKDAFASVV